MISRKYTEAAKKLIQARKRIAAAEEETRARLLALLFPEQTSKKDQQTTSDASARKPNQKRKEFMVANTRIETRQTPPIADGFGKAKSTLLAIFERKRRQSLIWFGIAVAAWVWAVWDRHSLIEQLTQRREVVVIDSLGTYYVSPVVDIEHAKELHAMADQAGVQGAV